MIAHWFRTCRAAAFFSSRPSHNAFQAVERHGFLNFHQLAVRIELAKFRFCRLSQGFTRVAQTTSAARKQRLFFCPPDLNRCALGTQGGYTLTELLVLLLYLACFVGLVAWVSGVMS